MQQFTTTTDRNDSESASMCMFILKLEIARKHSKNA